MSSIEELTLDLVRLGWTSTHRPPFPGIAQRDVDTAVGPRTLSVYARPTLDASATHLSAEYWSEGSNALAASAQIISSTDDQESRRKQVADFNAELLARVNQTYARRLLVEHGISDRR